MYFKGMCGRPSTTIGFERLYNPLARLDRASFISALTSAVPARPLNMTAIEATNRGVAEMPWVMLTRTAEVAEVEVTALASRESDAAVLDVREPEEYARGHVPGAINLPQAELATRLEEVPRDRPVFVICQGGMRSLRSAQFLRQMAIAQVANIRSRLMTSAAAWARSSARWRRRDWPCASTPTSTVGSRFATARGNPAVAEARGVGMYGGPQPELLQ
jgi:rhodanese-related sulfurtransferase